MTPREIAVAFWMAVALAFVLRSSSVRSAMAGAIRLLFTGKVALVNLTGLLWAVPVLYSGIALGVLGSYNIFATILWLAVVPMSLVFDVLNAEHRVGILRRSVLKSVSLTAIIEFIVSNWTFSLGIEMALVPITAIAATTLAFSQTREEYRDVTRLMTWVTGALGSVMLLNAGVALYRSTSIATVTDVLLAFAGPIWLVIGFTPWVALVAVYSDYDEAAIRLRIYGVSARDVRRCTMRVFSILGVRHKLVSQWRNSIASERVSSSSQAVELARSLRK